MMYRHFIAPSRGFTQFSHDLIRHPRLSSDAVRLLTWQLSLPDGARESLSRTAERARIGACAFTRAKRQLKAEGFVHELRVQVEGGRWATRQLVSNRPLSEGEAAKLMGRTPPPPPAPEPARETAPAPEPEPTPEPTPEPEPEPAPTPTPAPEPAPPSDGIPAVGAPTAPPPDGHPDEDRGEDTSTHPPEQAETQPQAPPQNRRPATPDEIPDEARALIGTLPLTSPALRHIPPGMKDELAAMAARWLAAGHTPNDIRAHVERGLPGPGTPVRRPGGLLRYLLRDIPPAAPLTPAPPQPAPPPGPRLSARLAGARECEGEQHIQPMLFRPTGDETLCHICTSAGTGAPGHPR